MAYDETNRGALFKNEQKESDKHPDYKGKVNVGGVDYWLSAWLKTAESGRKYMSLSVQPKEQAREERSEKPSRRSNAPGSAKSYGSAGDSDDVPF